MAVKKQKQNNNSFVQFWGEWIVNKFVKNLLGKKCLK